MNTADSHDNTPKFLDKLSGFLIRHRTTFVVALIVIAVAVVGLFVYLEIAANRTERSLVLVETLQTDFDGWLFDTDTDRNAGFEDLVSQIDAIGAKYSRSYAAQRAIFIHASALVEFERWEEASARYRDLADRFPDSYLAPISLSLAAVAAENAGDNEKALELLTYLVDSYDGQSAEIPRALFSIGRINEGMNNVLGAVEHYNQLMDEHPNSGWTNLARDRIITLTVQGRIGS